MHSDGYIKLHEYLVPYDMSDLINNYSLTPIIYNLIFVIFCLMGKYKIFILKNIRKISLLVIDDCNIITLVIFHYSFNFAPGVVESE